VALIVSSAMAECAQNVMLDLLFPKTALVLNAKPKIVTLVTAMTLEYA